MAKMNHRVIVKKFHSGFGHVELMGEHCLLHPMYGGSSSVRVAFCGTEESKYLTLSFGIGAENLRTNPDIERVFDQQGGDIENITTERFIKEWEDMYNQRGVYELYLFDKEKLVEFRNEVLKLTGWNK